MTRFFFHHPEGEDTAVEMLSESSDRWICMQFSSQYTQQIVQIWMKAAQMYATECTITINNHFVQPAWSEPLKWLNKTPKTDLLQTEIHIIMTLNKIKWLCFYNRSRTKKKQTKNKKYKDKMYITYKTLTLLYKIWIWSTSVAVNNFKKFTRWLVMTE